MAKYIYTVWKRKTASAQVKLFEGAWKDMINWKIVSEYVTRSDLFDVLYSATKITKLKDKVYFEVTVTGSGESAQAEAINFWIAKALIEKDPSLRPILKQALWPDMHTHHVINVFLNSFNNESKIHGTYNVFVEITTQDLPRGISRVGRRPPSRLPSHQPRDPEPANRLAYFLDMLHGGVDGNDMSQIPFYQLGFPRHNFRFGDGTFGPQMEHRKWFQLV